MKLSECNIGTIVKTIYHPDEQIVGHIVGLTINAAHQVVPVVRWANGIEKAINAYNLITLKEYEKGV